VLRRFVRERDALVAAVEHTPTGAFNHPAWWIERCARTGRTQWQALLRSANERPPMTLRVNARRCSGADLRAAAGRRRPRAPRCWTTRRWPARPWCWPSPARCSSCPGLPMATCRCRTRRRSAPRAWCWAWGPKAVPAGARVLDACAAPGGKTAQLLERADLDLLALDSDPKRIPRIHETLHRLHLKAQVQAADARDTAHWWDGRPFDAILLDAPCSASGIVRRHPDIRWLRRPDDLSALTRIQSELLQALWPLLKPGGRLVYATCSIFKAEGAAHRRVFATHAPGGAELGPASPGHLLPLADNPSQAAARIPGAVQDGFFYALIHKH
jgi:16S rRNA (cytosine967-C5)-methyltransferase